jgi:hypothetical protein
MASEPQECMKGRIKMFDHADASSAVSLPAVPSWLLAQIWRQPGSAVTAADEEPTASNDNDAAISAAKQALEQAQADFFQAAIRFRQELAAYDNNPMLERLYKAAQEAMRAKNAAGQKMNEAQRALDRLAPADSSVNRVPFRASIFKLPLPEKPGTVSDRMFLDRM